MSNRLGNPIIAQVRQLKHSNTSGYTVNNSIHTNKYIPITISQLKKRFQESKIKPKKAKKNSI